MNSYHGRLLDGAEAVDENVHSVFHGDSWIQKEERRDTESALFLRGAAVLICHSKSHIAV